MEVLLLWAGVAKGGADAISGNVACGFGVFDGAEEMLVEMAIGEEDGGFGNWFHIFFLLFMKLK